MYTVYTTFGNTKLAQKYIKMIISLKLAKCANIFPISSVYLWNKKIVNEKEVAVIFKTTIVKVRLLEKYLKENHPYDVPIIETIKVDKINSKYLAWLSKEK